MQSARRSFKFQKFIEIHEFYCPVVLEVEKLILKLNDGVSITM